MRNGRGSSPRLRGTLPAGCEEIILRGIIPALAGNTVTRRWPVRRTWDHPRACGEHRQTVDLLDGVPGSSPRLRGTLGWCPDHHDEWGIIPALAGNTRGGIGYRALSGDHPRACGEHLRGMRPSHSSGGSSPRLRGTPDVYPFLPVWGGIIPALAGNTTNVWMPAMRARDHPRACGEHVIQVASQHGHQGSSPRLRGTLVGVGTSSISSGIIPALAGNTFPA